jgi:hypothetical protein
MKERKRVNQLVQRIFFALFEGNIASDKRAFLKFFKKARQVSVVGLVGSFYDFLWRNAHSLLFE